MNGPAIRRVLLDLVGTASVADTGALADSDWDELDRLAAIHRLQPILHHRHAANRAIPARILADWQAAKRHAAMNALAQQADLRQAAHYLDEAGHAPVALKGAWLAFHAYPAPALRPMRDIDLLVEPARVIEAFHHLLANGFVQTEDDALPLDTNLRIGKHMPQLRAPGGTLIELHHRLWEPHGQLDHASPDQDLAGLIARARIAADGLRYPCATDMLAHLVVHAVYSHRLDCGPLLLHDIASTIAAQAPDWDRFWSAAHTQGWRDGARLVLELTARHITEAGVDFTADRGPPCPGELIEAAPDLMLQDLGTRASARVGAAMIRRGGASLLERARRQTDPLNPDETSRPISEPGGWLGWALSRGWRTARELAQADTRRQSRQLAALSAWLDR